MEFTVLFYFLVCLKTVIIKIEERKKEGREKKRKEKRKERSRKEGGREARREVGKERRGLNERLKTINHEISEY